MISLLSRGVIGNIRAMKTPALRSGMISSAPAAAFAYAWFYWFR